MAAPTTASSTRETTTLLVPRSGFRTPQFWFGLASVIAAFLLSQFGINLPANIVNDILHGNFNPQVVLTIVGVAAVAIFIAVSSWIETLLVNRKGVDPKKGKPAPAKPKRFYQTSEFWLGLVTVTLNYLEDSKIIPHQIAMVSPAAGTTTLALALVYSFGRSQLKQAYSSAQADDQVTKN